MSNNKMDKGNKFIKYAFGVLMFLGAGQAFAVTTAGNHIIENTVAVAYQNSSGDDFGDTASAQVIVDIIQIAPLVSYKETNLSAVLADITDLAESESYDVTLILESQSNGPELYSLAGDITVDTFVNLDAVVAYGTVTDFTLGASSVAIALALDTGTNGPTAINIPSDDANDGSINSFDGSSGETIRVITATGDDAICTITGIGDGTGGTGNAIGFITVDNCFADGDGTETEVAFTLAQGDEIVERLEVDIVVTTNVVATGFTTGTHLINVNADTSASGSDGAATGSPLTLTGGDESFIIYANQLNVYKYVRNIDTDQVLTASEPYDILIVSGGSLDTEIYYRSGGGDKGGELAAANGLSGRITAEPLETLEYAILVINDGGTATQVVVTDDQSATPFTQIDTATIQMMDVGLTTGCSGNTCTITQDGGGSTAAPATPASHNDADGDFGGMNGDILTIYAGTGADEDDGTFGTIAIGESALVVYQVTVD